MRTITISFVFILLILSFTAKSEVAGNKSETLKIVVYRSPTCGCCGKWVQHLRENQFMIEDILSEDMQAIKEKYGVPRDMASCHTAVIDGYVIEGHVPARDIKRLLKIRPKVVGISVPGMPVGTPGMEMGGRNAPYQVMSFDEKSSFQIFSQY